MNPDNRSAIDCDVSALAAATALAAEALALHRDALSIVADGWRSESSCSATNLLGGQCGDAAELVAALQGAAAEFRSLRDGMEHAGSAPDGAPEPAEPQQGYAQTSARIDDRPQPNFETPPGYAAPASAALPALSWPSVGLPDIGGSLVGLIAQIADAVVPEDLGAPPSADIPEESGTPPPTPEPPRQVDSAVPQRQPEPEPEPEPGPEPEPEPEFLPEPPPQPPLLAAEMPPEPAPPPPAAPVVESPAPPQLPAAGPDPRTPCEIAADELPQVGE